MVKNQEGCFGAYSHALLLLVRGGTLEGKLGRKLSFKTAMITFCETWYFTLYNVQNSVISLDFPLHRSIKDTWIIRIVESFVFL